MNIIEWINTNFDAGDAIINALIALVIWIIIWKLIICKILDKYNIYSLKELGVLGSFGILIFLLIPVVLFIASIQAIIEYGIRLLFPLLIFLGGFTVFVIFFIKKFNE